MSIPDLPDDPSEPRTAAESLAALPGNPMGIARPGGPRGAWLDALAGRASVFGFGFEPLIEAMRSAADRYWGDPLGWEDPTRNAEAGGNQTSGEALLELVRAVVRIGSDRQDGDEPLRAAGLEAAGLEVASVIVCDSADAAVERAIAAARRRTDGNRFRCVGLVGSDHGRSALCRSASGRPELHRGWGPLVPGFRHVRAGDITALQEAVDDETACVLLTPLDWSDSGRPLDAAFLQRAAECCREREAMLILDESRLCFGATGQPFSFREIAEVDADAVVLAGGLFGGLSGGVLLASQRLIGTTVLEVDRYPLQRSVLEVTLRQLSERATLAAARTAARPLATKLAETIGGFEFVRDLHVLGMTIGIETDLDSDELLNLLAREGVRVQTAGDHAICMQLPLDCPPSQLDELFRRLFAALESVERQAAADPFNGASLPS